MALPIYMAKALTEFERAVRADEMKGAYDPEDMEDIEAEMRAAREEMDKCLRRLQKDRPRA